MFKVLSLSLAVILMANGLLIMAAKADITVPTELQNKIVGVRLDDLVEVYPRSINSIANLKEVFSKNAQAIFNTDSIDVVHDIFFQELPENNSGNNHLELIALVKYKNIGLVFEKLIVEYNDGAVKFSDFQMRHETLGKSSDMIFIASVGLVDRKLILEDVVKNVKLVFPIGVGSFDEGVMNEGRVSLLTPRFQNGFLDKRVVISNRDKPKYFKNKPFIRILKGSDPEKDWTPIAFHIEINDQFVRGFDSHGCMRLREMDLMALHDIVMMGGQLQIPITLKYRQDDQSDNPILKRNKIFKTILNKGTKELPFFILDRDNLIQNVLIEDRSAPTDLLIDDPNDNYESLFSYETETQLNEQELRRTNDCKARVLKGEIKGDDKSFQKCVDEGKRKDTLADRIYRKYMGIDSIGSSRDSIF
jgi:hypothetical protein